MNIRLVSFNSVHTLRTNQSQGPDANKLLPEEVVNRSEELHATHDLAMPVHH